MVKGVYKRYKANQKQIAIFKDGDEKALKLEGQLFVHDNYRKFAGIRLAAQRWYTEGKAPKLEDLKALGYPEEDAKRWLELAKNPTEKMVNARKMTQIKEDEWYDLASEFFDEMGYVEDHVTRRWEHPSQYLDWEGKTMANKPIFAKGRKWLTQADGIEAGMKPKTLDIRDDIKAMNNMRVNILSRIHAFQKLGASVGQDGLPAMMNEAEEGPTQARAAKLTPISGQAPKSWLRFPGNPLLKDVAINPYYKQVVKYMMARPFQGGATPVLDFAAASTKAAKLWGSMFHGYSEGEMLLSGINFRDVFSFNKNKNTLIRGMKLLQKAALADMDGEPFNKNPIKAVGQLYDSFMKGHGILANRPLAMDMVEHGFKLGPIDDDVYNILSRHLKTLENSLSKKIGEGAAKGITALPRAALDIQNKVIFDYQRVISSMLMYEDSLADNLKKFNLDAPEGKKIPIDDIKTQTANQISKAMGGISYAQFMVHPKVQQTLQWMMLAPEWTIGRALMGASVFQKGPEGRQARKQMARLFLGWFTVSNIMNYENTKKYLGKGRYIWDNPEGFRDQVFWKQEPDKSTKYIQTSKALTEIGEDIFHPFRTVAHKASPPIQSFVKAMNWSGGRDYYSNPYEKPESPLKTMAESYDPMIVSGNSALGGLPVRRGPSKNAIMGMIDQWYAGGMKDNRLYNRAFQVGEENGYDVSKLDREVRANRTRQEKRAILQ